MNVPRKTLASLYRNLGERGLNVGSSGNVSARHRRGMLITPTGIAGDAVTARTIVECTLDGAAKGRLAPSSEWQMHAAIYRACPDARVIVHSHADAATALACLGEPLPAFHYAVATFGGDSVPIVPYVLFGSAELAQSVGEAIIGHSACLLANHGMICCGPDVATTLTTALTLETLCRQYLLARAAGRPALLSPAQMAQARARYRSYGSIVLRKTTLQEPENEH